MLIIAGISLSAVDIEFFVPQIAIISSFHRL